ncbi:MAG: hypothetical protein WCJ40_19945 [Planctomycetota bacterium]
MNLVQSIMNATLMLWALPAMAVESAYDLIIRNGQIVDGTGNPWRAGDLAIKGAVLLPWCLL